VLVRQYYVEFDPNTGLRMSKGDGSPLSDGKGPSAALVKATLINAARSLQGSFTYFSGTQATLKQSKVADAPNPRYIEGFGIPNLNNVLVFASSRIIEEMSLNSSGMTNLTTTQSKNQTLIIFDRQSLKAKDAPHVFAFSVQAGGYFKATLVYTDPPGPVRKAFDPSPALVNDLDILVTCDSTTRSSCSSKSLNTTIWSSASRLDNVEQVPSTTNAPWRFESNVSLVLQVVPTNIAVGVQPYALVVSGAGIFYNSSRSSRPNWVPEWTKTAKTQSTINLKHDRVLMGALIAGAIFVVLIIISLAWGLIRMRRERNEDDSAHASET
jgi:hypothetical protein